MSSVSDEKFITRDLNLIAYLDMKGIVYSMVKNGTEFNGVFDNDEVAPLVQDFYIDKDGFLAYANKLRNLKSRMRNTL